MSATLPIVEDGLLHTHTGSAAPLVVGSPEWLQWLDAPETRSFAFRTNHGSITVRKDARARGGSYWVAYRKVRGKLHNFYLGKSADLTLQRLNAAASALAAAQNAPADPTGVGAAPVVSGSGTARFAERTRKGAAGKVVREPGSAANSADTIRVVPPGTGGTVGIGEPPSPLDTLLRTKLHVPPPSAALVSRDRLLQRLQMLVQRPLGVVIAPAGFGKTTLLTEWIYRSRTTGKREAEPGQPAELAPVRVGWLGLDEQDNDPTRFWLYVIAALRAIHPGLSEEALYLLKSGAPQLSQVVTLVANYLSEHHATSGGSSEHTVLVLDDYHLISSSHIHESMALLLDALPPHAHIIMLSRHDPPLPLARMRARGQLVELRASDLRFTPGESAQFLNDYMGLQLEASDIQILEQRTEGWIAGLQMAALSLQDRHDRRALIQRLNGSHRYVLDYLVEEVLREQPDEVQRFLLRTSVLDRLCAPLCDAVLAAQADGGGAGGAGGAGGGSAGVGEARATGDEGNRSAQRMLEHLEKSNLFLTPMDDERRWYRYHHLFADVLRVRLREAWPNLVPRLHRGAAQWFVEQWEGSGDLPALESALGYLIAAGAEQDISRAADIIEREGEALWSRGESGVLLLWIERLPMSLVASRPWLAVLYALFLQAESRSSKVPALLGAAEQASIEGETLDPVNAHRVGGWVATIRSHLLRNRQDYEAAITLSEKALSLLPESDRRGRAAAYWALALSQHMRGDLEPSLGSYRATHALTDPLNDPYLEGITRCLQAHVLFEMGRLGAVAEPVRSLAARAMSYFSHSPATGGIPDRGRHGTERSAPVPPVAGWALVELGRVAFERNELSLAADLLEKGVALAQRGGVRDAICVGYSSLVPLYLARSETDKAGGVLAEFTRLAEETHYAFYLDWAAAVAVRLYLAGGDLAAASAWAALYRPLPGALFYSQKLGYDAYIRVLMAEERWEEALDWINKQLPGAQAHDHGVTAVELTVLSALCEQALGHRHAALQALGDALAQASTEGMFRVFLEGGRHMARLLSEWMGSKDAKDAVYSFAKRVLGAFPEEQRARAGMAVLGGSKRDTGNPGAGDTLVEPLTPREQEILSLIAEGCSTQQIAERLVVTTGTVKTHLHHLYGKLDARDRTHALVRARELNLLA